MSKRFLDFGVRSWDVNFYIIHVMHLKLICHKKISCSLLKSDRTVRSVTTQGPINLGIGTFDSQPFSENIPYYLGVTLTNNDDWFGNLKELKDVLLYMPPNINVAGEGNIQGECDS